LDEFYFWGNAARKEWEGMGWVDGWMGHSSERRGSIWFELFEFIKGRKNI
jgi:hypothetical protein